MTDDTTAPVPGGRRQAVLTALLALIGLAIGLLLAEIVLRVWVRVGGNEAQRLADFDPLRVQVQLYGTVGYRQRPGAQFRYDNGTVAHANSMGYRGPEVTREKPVGVRRVVLIGGSTTHGWGVDDSATIDAYMRRRLAMTTPRFEVINAGLDGYDSRQILERVQHDVLALDPDVLIINAGINDVRNARFPNLVDDDERTLIWRGLMQRMREEAEHGRSLWTVAKHYSLVARLPEFLISRAQQRPVQDRTLVGYPDAANYFERHLRQIAALAKSRGIKLIFATPASSLRTRYAPTAPPEKSYWLRDAETTQRYRDTLAARMRRVAGELATRGQPVVYLRPDVAPEHFLDDAHLTSEGNAAVADAFADAVLRLIRP